jgi:hypothetical protein
MVKTSGLNEISIFPSHLQFMRSFYAQIYTEGVFLKVLITFNFLSIHPTRNYNQRNAPTGGKSDRKP